MLWNENSGAHRVRYAQVFEAETRRHDQRFRELVPIAAGDAVLDVGCGTGVSTREAARFAASVLGADLSEVMLEHARQQSADLPNVRYLRADAQVHPFPEAGFDVVISRFGVMFFADPVAAFRNLARALRPGGRLAILVWQHREHNEWALAPLEALAPAKELPPPGPAFSFADPGRVEEILVTAGFHDVRFTDIREPVYYGPDPETAEGFVLGLQDPREALAASEDRRGALARLRNTLAGHATEDGVLFDSRTWLVRARCSG
ncbi:methyltransferase domain-containing protein [Amycolatopsis acidicola]|uniref:Methyltransferase domain-containing protein n=1 Tax=Amycolatopsis acidicola TaxID=2596893 RepID=A0A5N0UQ30_9PSEU|nr:class I SAM-dependent methyltransferase [Amycolatopsis acidicola]KAA9152988.1 methyltransferase domain-containing protein [Amycolatopsis acidicola]